MKSRIRTCLIITSVVAVIMTMFAWVFLSYNALRKQVWQELKKNSYIIEKLQQDDVNDAVKLMNYRVTYITKTGNVIADSQSDGDIGSHINRPEVAQAITMGEGYSARRSNTIEKQTIYYARNIGDGTILRISTESSTIWEVLIDALPVSVGAVLLLLWLSTALSTYFTRRLVMPIEHVLKSMRKPGCDSNYDEFEPLFRLLKEKNDALATANDMLKLKQDELEIVTENVRDGVIFIDNSNKIVFMNSSAFLLFGVQKHSVEGNDIIFFSRNRRLLKAIETMKDKHSYVTETEIDGRVLQISIKRVERQERCIGMICVVTDTSEYKNVVSAANG